MRLRFVAVCSALAVVAIFVAGCAVRLHGQVSQLCSAGNLGEDFCTGAQLREAIFGGFAVSSAAIVCALLLVGFLLSPSRTSAPLSVAEAQNANERTVA